MTAPRRSKLIYAVLGMPLPGNLLVFVPSPGAETARGIGMVVVRPFQGTLTATVLSGCCLVAVNPKATELHDLARRPRTRLRGCRPNPFEFIKGDFRGREFIFRCDFVYRRHHYFGQSGRTGFSLVIGIVQATAA